MNKVIYKLVYNRRKTLNKNGMALIQVEAYLNKKKKYFSTNIYLKPEQWDSKKLLVKKHPNADALNQMIYSFWTTIERKELELWKQGKSINLEMLKNALDMKGNADSFLDFYQHEVATSFSKESTKHNHLSTLAVLRDFRKEVCFTDLTFEFVASFESFLLSRGYHINTIAKHMKHLKRYINTAINKEYIELQNYAFRKYKIKTIEGKHTYLSFEELEKLENLTLNGRHKKYQRTLDAFLFCCYTGIRYSDFIRLSGKNIIEIQDKTWIIYKSVKTGTEVRLPLYLLFGGRGLNVLEKYKENLQQLFCLQDNSNVNKELILISQLAGIIQRISFHTARHTNATLLIYKGINITTVQKLLGHKNVRTTQIYASIMDMTIIHDLERSES